MKRLVAGILGIFILGLVAASAFASGGDDVFLCGGQPIGGRRYVRVPPCGLVFENLEEWRYQDRGATLSIECAVGTEVGGGEVGPGSESEVTKVEFVEPKTNCTPSAKALNLKEEEVTNGCESALGVEAVDLPWLVLALQEGGESVASVESGGNGEPGYTFKCLVAGLTETDTCKSAEKHGGVVPLKALRGGLAELPLLNLIWGRPRKSEEEATCTRGGAESGLLTLELLFAAKIGGIPTSLELGEE
jgi:hypothetical protein